MFYLILIPHSRDMNTASESNDKNKQSPVNEDGSMNFAAM
jgi:hypothetical protein